jgi:aminopeptidase
VFPGHLDHRHERTASVGYGPVIASSSTAPFPPDETVLAPDDLARYADAIVVGCLGLGEGDMLFVSGEPDHRELVVALAEAAYRAGARLVEPIYDDLRARRAKLQYAREEHLGVVYDWSLRRAREQTKEHAAAVSILSQTDPGALDGIPPERIAADQLGQMKGLASVRRVFQRGRRRWTGVAWPTPAWAERVYPELDSLEGRRQLGADLLWFCRLGPDDPPDHEGWRRHAETLARRNTVLTELELERLELRGPGTELDLRLAPGTCWLGGPRANAYGQVVTANFPTEENFTSPDPPGTSGTFRCTRPLVFQGRSIEGIAGEFRGGRLVRLEAARDEDRDLLAAFLFSEPAARRLGEVALVDRASRIGQSGRTYWNTLLDENAAAHMAFGFGFTNTRLPEARKRVNRGNLHLDVMIGSDELEATGIAAGGRRVPLIADGEWQVE